MPPSTSAAVLAECNDAGKTGAFILDDHAFDQAQKRKRSRPDIRNALSNATDATLQSNGRWLITGGTDIDGVPVALVANVSRGVVIITVF